MGRLRAETAAAAKIQEQMNEENRRLKEQIEQERRDHELALRLAAESNSGVVEDSNR